MGENSDTLIKDRHESHGHRWGGNREQYEQTKKNWNGSSMQLQHKIYVYNDFFK